MMNFSLHSFSWAMRLLDHEIAVAVQRTQQNPTSVINNIDREHALQSINYITHKCRELMLSSAENRIQRIYRVVTTEGQTYFSLGTEFGTLKEAIEDDIKTEYFYHYPHRQAVQFFNIPGDWASALAKGAFPSARPEIESAVDCWALGQPTACVFHLMRVAELGLRAMSRERGVSFPDKPIEWAEWQTLIDKIESEGRAYARTFPKGLQRDAALAFYTGASGQFHAFKELYRNAVMHMRRSYDDLQAERAINQVRDFMNGLSAKIGEKTKMPIRRWP